MNIGNYEISLKNRKREQRLAKKSAKKSKSAPSGIKPVEYAGKVSEYSQIMTKTFGTYKTASGDSTLSYDIVEGLYRRTVMHKVINKLSGDSARLGFKVLYTNMDGEPHEQAAEIGKEIDRLITRNTLKYMTRDRNIYGDAFLYKQVGPSPTGNINIQDMYLVHPRWLQPVNENSVLGGWTYTSGAGESIDLSPEEIVHIPRDPITQQLYGISCFEPVLQVLNLILNSQLNSALILDRFAIPLVHWQIDSKNEKRKTPLSEILQFVQNLTKMKIGSDIVTDSSIKTEIVADENSMIDFSPMMDKLDDYFFATTGVPGSILGMKADNMSAITRQLQTYYDNIFDEQMTSFDYLINDVYWPEMINAGIDDLYSIDFTTSKPMVEQESRIMTWVDMALKAGVIDRPEGRQALGYMGPPPEVPDVFLTVQPQGPGAPGPDGKPGAPEPNGPPEAHQPKKPQFDKKQRQKVPPGVKTK